MKIRIKLVTPYQENKIVEVPEDQARFLVKTKQAKFVKAKVK